jgi:hypothetical protein
MKAIVSEDYDYAERLERLSADLRRATGPDPVADRRQESALLLRRIEKARADLAEENEDWDRAFKAFMGDQLRQRQALIASHHEAERQYEAKWNRAEALIPFSKASPELLRLRKMQKSLALTKRFGEARDLKEHANAVQEQEARAGEERAMGSVRAGFSALRERHRRELECFDGHKRTLVTYLELERAKAIEPLVTLVKALEATTDQSHERRKEHGVKVRRKGVAVTRTATSQLEEFKRPGEPQRLNLNAIVVRKFAARKRRLVP